LHARARQAWQFSPAEARRAGSSGGRGHLLLSLGADGRLLVWRAAGGKLEAPIKGCESCRVVC
jgi:hypothetical protein